MDDVAGDAGAGVEGPQQKLYLFDYLAGSGADGAGHGGQFGYLALGVNTLGHFGQPGVGRRTQGHDWIRDVKPHVKRIATVVARQGAVDEKSAEAIVGVGCATVELGDGAAKYAFAELSDYQFVRAAEKGVEVESALPGGHATGSNGAVDVEALKLAAGVKDVGWGQPDSANEAAGDEGAEVE